MGRGREKREGLSVSNKVGSSERLEIRYNRRFKIPADECIAMGSRTRSGSPNAV